jgi:hypothetical protein
LIFIKINKKNSVICLIIENKPTKKFYHELTKNGKGGDFGHRQTRKIIPGGFSC